MIDNSIFHKYLVHCKKYSCNKAACQHYQISKFLRKPSLWYDSLTVGVEHDVADTEEQERYHNALLFGDGPSYV